MLKNIRQSILVKMFCLLSIASILYTSCSKEANGVATPENYLSKTKVDLVALASSQKSIMSAVFKRGDLSKAQDLSQRYDIMQEEIQKSTGSTASCTDFLKVQAAYDKYGKDKDFDQSLSALLTDKVLSKKQGEFLANLNTKMLDGNLSQDVFFANLANFEKDVVNNAEMSVQEKDYLVVFANVVKNQTLLQAEMAANGPENACGDCIWSKKWKIFGWGALWATPVAAACVVFTGPAAPACIIIVVGVAFLGEIRYYCGKECPNI